MHACGHDMHVTCLLGAAAALGADRGSWQGTLMLVFQPAEEVGGGAQAMVDDGPVVMAAATVMRLQGIVSREVAGTETAVVTVGALRTGSKENIIPDDAELLLSIRSFDKPVRDQVIAAIERIVRAEAMASGALAEPDITAFESFPAVVNDPAACARTRERFEADLGSGLVFDPGLVTGSEDVGILASAAGAPCVYWLLGGADPATFAGAAGVDDVARIVRGLPSNHSPLFAPVIEPTLSTGIAALGSAARCWLPAETGPSCRERSG